MRLKWRLTLTIVGIVCKCDVTCASSQLRNMRDKADEFICSRQPENHKTFCGRHPSIGQETPARHVSLRQKETSKEFELLGKTSTV